MRSTFKVLSYVKKGSEKPNGNLSLMCSLTVDREIKQFSCKMDVPLRLWSVKNNRASVARRIHRNCEPPVAVHEHQDHADIRQNHRPEDKSRHENLVTQAGEDGEEHLPSQLVTLKQHTDERRKEHHHDR